jgi:hypothetical protein
MTSSDGNHGPSHAEDDAHEEDHGPPPPPEPQTPMWLPAVGAVLFLSVGLIWALSTPPKDPTETMGSPAGTVVQQQAPATQTAPPPTPPPTPTGQPAKRGAILPH